jgi:Xaa-Pro aminopeptidase
MSDVVVAEAGVGFGRLRAQLDEIRVALRELGLDGWLLYDLRARNPIAGGLLEMRTLTRRYFVLVRAEGDPVLIEHAIETGPWAGWPWRRRRYSAWRELDAVLREELGGLRRVAMEVSPGDAVPVVDLVPAGVVELIRKAGPEVVSSGDLMTRFYSRWSAEDLASHRRAAEVLREVAYDAFRYLAGAIAVGERVTEAGLRDWVLAELAARGCGAGADCHAANGVNAADPHYCPVGGGATFRAGDLVLLDLWAKERDDSVYADQTWMAYLGVEVPARVNEVWTAVRDARDAAVEFLRRRWKEGRPIQGYEVDDVARQVIAERGFGAAFIHRTGHSIDTSTHGMGPNIDNFETHEVRTLIPGVGFSIEPGIYIPGEIGVRSEINVYIGEDGPEVTPSEIQRDVLTFPADRG